tara:strand:- start:120 stop:3602 length:3483 start_codon:yes stop_codon:yes gene_type:complete
MSIDIDKNSEPEKYDQKKIQDSRISFNNMIQSYLESNPVLKDNGMAKELEIRFGSNRKLAKNISKIDYDNVVKTLYSCGFTPDVVDGNQILRIRNEFIDKNTGTTKLSNIRAEIIGSQLIKQYCKTNSIQSLIDSPYLIPNQIIFTKKMTALNKNGEPIKPVDIKEFNFRASFQTEQTFVVNSGLSKQIIKNWNDSKKIFRCINRVRFSHPDFPLFVDLSIVKSSRTKNYVQVPEYTVQDANLFNNSETYEIEIEIDNTDNRTAYYNTEYTDSIISSIKKAIRIILSGLQNTKFPISYFEIQDIKQQYLKLLFGKDFEIPHKISGYHFIGPSSLTLQHQNLIDNPDNKDITSILHNFTVTDKADGDRMLLFINSSGKIYLIDKNLNIIFTGVITKQKKIFNSILDGEFIKFDKNGNLLNLYAAFDIYFVNGKDVRSLPLTFSDNDDVNDDELIENKKTRLNYLNTVVDMVDILSVLNSDSKQKKPTHFKIQSKVFYSTASGSIFQACSTILSNTKDSLFDYNTDGLIFTPSDFPVGGDSLDKPGPLSKHTWSKSFKWKPPEFNTIDFLVTVKKDDTHKDDIHHVFNDGISLTQGNNVSQYKTLILRCGFDEKKHGYMNPYQNIISDELPSSNIINDDENSYKPVPFVPNNPYDENAYLCNVMLHNKGDQTYMITEENEYFEENMIVEFSYDKTKPGNWKWIPLRVRYDKTSELRSGIKNYGNPFYVANSNWHTIHFPITENMLSTGENISDYDSHSDVYYNHNANKTITRNLRNFHNFLKKNLIKSVSNRNDTLIDYSVGKAGDLHKWNNSRLSFVYGIDISKDNIHNPLDGACARYLDAFKNNNKLPKVLFSVGNSGSSRLPRSIRSGDAFDNDKDKQISKALFGDGPKDLQTLGKGVYNNYGVALNGFNIGSCQFSMHYFFENKLSFHNFLKNISDTIKVDGYFIGTCFDGKTVFNNLVSKTINSGYVIMQGDYKMFEIVKLYSQTGFPDDDNSLGYPINVYQESINQYFREYLVNFDYFVQIMEDYGFNLISDDEASNIGMFKSSSLFSEYFDAVKNNSQLNQDYFQQYKHDIHMSDSEKNISFLNRFFIFKKNRNVDTNKLFKIFVNQSNLSDNTTIPDNNSNNNDNNDNSNDNDDNIPIKPKVRKLKKNKILIQS